MKNWIKATRFWIVGILVGDSSYIKNCQIIGGKVSIRPDHYITCCNFLDGGYVFTHYARFPEEF